MTITTAEGHTISTRHVAAVIVRTGGNTHPGMLEPLCVLEVFLAGGQTIASSMLRSEAEPARDAIVAAMEAEEA